MCWGLLLAGCVSHGYAQTARFEHLSSRDGLSHSSVTSIVQDRRGFMWFGTTDGLNKYDGYQFTVYKHEPDNPNSLNNSYIQSLLEDRQGNLWISAFDGGLTKFNSEEGTFHRYVHLPDSSNTLSHNRVHAIFEGQDGSIWIGTEYGLNKLDQETNKFTHYTQATSGLSADIVTALHEDKDGILWIGTFGGGLSRFDPAEQQWTHYGETPDSPWRVSSRFVWSIYKDRWDRLWLGTEEGLTCVDTVSGEVAYFFNEPGNPNSLSHNTIRTVYASGDDMLWIGTQGGLNRLDLETLEITPYTHRPEDESSLSHDFVTTIHESDAGILWVGTGGGLDKLVPEKQGWHHYSNEPGNPNSLSHNRVLSLTEDPEGILWVGTNTMGLDRFDRSSSQWSHFQHDPSDANSLSHNIVFSTHVAQDGLLWIGTSGGVNHYNLRTRRLNQLREQDKAWLPFRSDSKSPNLFYSVVAILEDREGVLWFGGWLGLQRFDPKRGVHSHFNNDPNDPNSLRNTAIGSLFEDSKGTLWIGSFGGGLEKITYLQDGNGASNPEDRIQFVHYVHDAQDSTSLSNNFVNAFLETREGDLWVGTSGGLNKLIPEEGSGQLRFIRYTEENGLPGNEISSLLEDDDGYIWIGTKQGLSRFDPRTESTRNYGLSDGLPVIEFNTNAVAKSKTGAFLFGGANGFVSFFPGQIADNAHVPPIVLTSFETLNEEVAIGPSLVNTGEIELQHTENIFTFRFAALDFAAPEMNQYAYRMEGLNDEWIELGVRNDMTFTGLDPGEYTFSVKGSNNHGVWNEEGASIKITIHPPFWNTWWFRSLSILAIAALVIGAFQVRTRNIRQHNKALQTEIVERQRAQQAQHLSEQRILAISENSPDAILFYGLEDGQVEYANPACEQLTGYTLEEFFTSEPPKLSHPEDQPVVMDLIRQAKNGHSTSLRETRLFTKQGTLKWVEMYWLPLYDQDHELVGTMSIFRDITERKKVESERELLIDELEAKNAELERFTYTVSHDLKSPLVTIKGFLGLLQQDVAEGNVEQVNSDVGHISVAADKMHRLLDELLELSRIGRLINPPESLSLTQVAEEAVELLAGQITQNEIRVVIAPDMPRVQGDRIRILEVFQNLVDNAAKFMGDQKAPCVEIGGSEKDGMAVCYVKDNGIGIHARYHEKVFGLFDRLGTEVEGTGIGLALVKRIVEVHEGSIWIDSEGQGQGSTFWFTLPVDEQSMPPVT